jgi:DNA-binding MarR family transcriptional regulator
MDVSRQAVRLTVHELEAIGAVSLAPSPRDRKAQIVVLTPLGQSRLELISAVEERWVTDLTDGFEDRSLAQAAWLIRIVRERALARQR